MRGQNRPTALGARTESTHAQSRSFLVRQVIVSSVGRRSQVRGQLLPGDCIAAVDGKPVKSTKHQFIKHIALRPSYKSRRHRKAVLVPNNIYILMYPSSHNGTGAIGVQRGGGDTQCGRRRLCAAVQAAAADESMSSRRARRVPYACRQVTVAFICSATYTGNTVPRSARTLR